MNYQPLEHYTRRWIFTHASMPLSDDLLEKIRPLTQGRSSVLWREFISAMASDADHFGQGDWAANPTTWKEEASWQEAWDGDEPALPEDVLAFIGWEDNTTVYFCYEKYNIVETDWGTFKQCWKNFLFFDDGPILLGRRQKEVLWFNSQGLVQLGERTEG
uniref:DUF2947 domain-containing protein n=1 Tax=Thaumasiovibrio occultus TaxID=1891184 RepID=UPI000B34B8F7|nr:DUF2947 domain-containing protein [Thaumasiovibrio occultus]